jgi:coproporphyrinogen III oxidase
MHELHPVIEPVASYCFLFIECYCSKAPEEILKFSEDAVNHVVEAYCPLVKKHKDDKFTPEQKQWQAVRRGRYVEFNLVYDR